MSRLLKAEFFKLRKSNVFKVLIIVSIFFGIASLGLIKISTSESFIKNSLKTAMTEEQTNQYIEQMKKITSKSDDKFQMAGNIGLQIKAKDMFNPTGKEIFYSSFGSGIIEIFISVFAGFLVAKEYSKGTIKNSLSYGKKRYKYYLGKVAVVSSAAIICSTIITAIITIAGSFIWKWGTPFTFSEALNIIKTMLLVYLIIISLSSILVLIATVVKSSGGTIVIGIVIFSIVLNLMGALYGIADIFDNVYRCFTPYNLSIITSNYVRTADYIRTIVCSLGITAVTSALGAYVLQKQDIK